MPVPFKQTGSKHLKRDYYWNKPERDIDIPDGDPALGKLLYKEHCQGCHQLESTTDFGPRLIDVYGRKVGVAKGFYYSPSFRGMRGTFRWSKQNLFRLLTNPEEMFRETNMSFEGLGSNYEKICIIQYLHSINADKVKI